MYFILKLVFQDFRSQPPSRLPLFQQGEHGCLIAQRGFVAALAKMLNGQNSTCNENTAACDYLNAISYARSANESMLIKSLKSAKNKDSNY